MHIVLEKISDEVHGLAIVREDGSTERVQCETRSYLMHDLLHYAVEGEAELDGGFWGNLARGKTLEQMNDRTGKAIASEAPQILMIEQIVGALTPAVKGRSGEEILAGLEYNAAALQWEVPPWLTADFISTVQKRMRALLGRWKATPYGDSMDLYWPPRP